MNVFYKILNDFLIACIEVSVPSVQKFPPIFQQSFVSHSLGYRDLSNAVFGMAKHSNFLKLVIHTAKESYKSAEYRARKDIFIELKALERSSTTSCLIVDGFLTALVRDFSPHHL